MSLSCASSSATRSPSAASVAPRTTPETWRSSSAALRPAVCSSRAALRAAQLARSSANSCCALTNLARASSRCMVMLSKFELDGDVGGDSETAPVCLCARRSGDGRRLPGADRLPSPAGNTSLVLGGSSKLRLVLSLATLGPWLEVEGVRDNDCGDTVPSTEGGGSSSFLPDPPPVVAERSLAFISRGVSAMAP